MFQTETYLKFVSCLSLRLIHEQGHHLNWRLKNRIKDFYKIMFLAIMWIMHCTQTCHGKWMWNVQKVCWACSLESFLIFHSSSSGNTTLLSVLNAYRNIYNVFVLEFGRSKDIKAVFIECMNLQGYVHRLECVSATVVRLKFYMCVCLWGMQSNYARQRWCMFSFWLRISAFRGIPSAAPLVEALRPHCTHTLTLCS